MSKSCVDGSGNHIGKGKKLMETKLTIVILPKALRSWMM
jgi:hypothetical protein